MSRHLDVLLVDDEPPARSRLRRLLERRPEAVSVREAADGEETAAAILERRPDLVFLDVQMPGLDGFQVIEAVSPAAMPAVVFVTAWDRYALEAFDAGAVDYLLKPYDDERFHLCFERALAALSTSSTGALERLLASIGPRLRPPLSRIPVRTESSVRFVPVEEVEWIEAEDVYVRLHGGGRSWLLRQSLSHLEERLDGNHFLRVHRSALVNVDRIVEIRPLMGGSYEIVLAGGARVRSSRSHREAVQRLLEL